MVDDYNHATPDCSKKTSGTPKSLMTGSPPPGSKTVFIRKIMWPAPQTVRTTTANIALVPLPCFRAFG